MLIKLLETLTIISLMLTAYKNSWGPYYLLTDTYYRDLKIKHYKNCWNSEIIEKRLKQMIVELNYTASLIQPTVQSCEKNINNMHSSITCRLKSVLKKRNSFQMQGNIRQRRLGTADVKDQSEQTHDSTFTPQSKMSLIYRWKSFHVVLTTSAEQVTQRWSSHQRQFLCSHPSWLVML